MGAHVRLSRADEACVHQLESLNAVGSAARPQSLQNLEISLALSDDELASALKVYSSRAPSTACRALSEPAG